MKLGVWIALGVGIGTAIGAAINQTAMGVALGAAFGTALGTAFSGKRRYSRRTHSLARALATMPPSSASQKRPGWTTMMGDPTINRTRRFIRGSSLLVREQLLGAPVS